MNITQSNPWNTQCSIINNITNGSINLNSSISLNGSINLNSSISLNGSINLNSSISLNGSINLNSIPKVLIILSVYFCLIVMRGED